MSDGPLIGKTYSLEDAHGSSDAYYRRIALAADQLLRTHDAKDLLAVLRRAGRNRRSLDKLFLHPDVRTFESFLVNFLRLNFAQYTPNTANHLRELSLRRLWDRTLATTEPQYHLFMLESEIVNRMNVSAFRCCDTKLAFLPHCLKDLDANCHSVIRGDDYVCKGCSRICTVNAVTKLLRRHGVKPYIWMTADLRSLLSRLKRSGSSVGVLGIACIPELVNGMRMCLQARVPVVGIPLDANRCARWFGELHPNAVNIGVLEVLLGEETLLTRTTLEKTGRSIPAS